MKAADLAQQTSGRVLLVAKAGEPIGRRWVTGCEGVSVGHYEPIPAPADLYAEIDIDGDELQALALAACTNKSKRSRDGAIRFKAVRR